MHLVRLFVVVEKQMATTLFMNSDRNSGQRSWRFCLNIGFQIDIGVNFEYTFNKGSNCLIESFIINLSRGCTELEKIIVALRGFYNIFEIIK